MMNKACLFVLVLTASVFARQPAFAQPAPAQANPTEAVCRVCHADKYEALQTNPHRVIDTAEWRERTGNAPGCVNCHGDVGMHIATGGRGNVFTFRDEPPMAQTEVCQNCHAATHPEFDMSAHAQAGLSCASCHTQHAATAAAALLRRPARVDARHERLGASTALCTDCHDDILTAFALNERHRLVEGALECTSCHDPHAPVTRSLLGGFRQQQCMECHQDKGGPFVFEHAASRVEGCTACHQPHGSPNRHLLTHQQPAELCIGCHAVLPQFHVGFSPAAPPRFGLETQCTNCHAAIHGSNFDPSFLK
jgi:DmsE family decaheme c-type cytochrome